MIAYALLAVGALRERQRTTSGESDDELAMVPVSPRELLALLRVFVLYRPARTPIPRTRSTGPTGAANTSNAQPTTTADGTTSRQQSSHDRTGTSLLTNYSCRVGTRTNRPAICRSASM